MGRDAITSWRWILRVLATIAWLISIPWAINTWKGSEIPYEAIIAFFTGLGALIASFFLDDAPKSKNPNEGTIHAEANKPLSNKKDSTSEEKYFAYILGFTLSKISWYHGDSTQLTSLRTQYKLGISKLGLDEELAKKILNNFKPTVNLGDVIKNAHLGIEGRNSLSIAITLQYDEIVSAAFRLGYNIIGLCPQLEFLQIAQENPSPRTPASELLDTMHNQFDSLLHDAESLKLPSAQIDGLREVYSLTFNGKPGLARERLIAIGLEIEGQFRAIQTPSS